MQRRAFVSVGTTAALTSLAARTPIRLASPAKSRVSDMNAYLAKIDAGMARIGTRPVTSRFPHWRGDRLAADAMVRTAFQSLFITGMVGDLSAEDQAHPGIQERVTASMPLMDEAVDRTTAHLASQSGADLLTIQEVLRASDVAGAIALTIDREARLSGVSDFRRAQLSSYLGQVEWRLRNQDPALIISEYRDKIERASAVDVTSEARQRWLAARVGDATFWQADSVRLLSKHDDRLRRGAKTMGIGLLIFGAGGVLCIGPPALCVAGVITATVGAIYMLVGLITILVGLASSDELPKSAP